MSQRFEMECFAKVVEEGSFTAAARALGVSKSMVSREVASLEKRLDNVVFDRTTRRVDLTQVGQVYYERVRMILEMMEETERTIHAMQDVPSGVLRVTVPASYGRLVLIPHIFSFLAQYPYLEIDLHSTDRRVDLAAEGIDLAIRIGTRPDSSLHSRCLGFVDFVVCASPAYLAKQGTPTTPTELIAHSCLEFSERYARGMWRFSGPEGEVAVRVEGRVYANTGEALVEAAVAGLGVIYVPRFLAEASLAEGQLVSLMDAYCQQSVGIYAMYLHNRHLSAKVRLLVESLAEEFDAPDE